MSESHPDSRVIDRLRLLSEVFRPSGPITEQDLFSGRISQLAAVSRVIREKGQHGVIFGERGVGKTSLAAVSGQIFAAGMSMRINCDGSDNFASVWEKVTDELAAMARSRREPLSEATKLIFEDTIELLHYDTIGPDRVRQALRLLSEAGPVLIFFDEFDRVSDPATHSLIADTIKTLSDQLVEATLIVVGVADDVESLIANHRSVERALAQIPMPRMTTEEVQGIIAQGFQRLDLTTDLSLMYRLSRLPQGLPHFAHLLAQEAATVAILEDRDDVNQDDVHVAIAQSIEKADESMTQSYVNATTSSHKTLYDNVLLACALTDVDDLGFFAPGDLRGHLKRITGETYDIPRYARHLVQFCNERGPVLERRGGEHRWRYRFINPMMRPYIVMRAASSGVSDDVLRIAPASTEP